MRKINLIAGHNLKDPGAKKYITESKEAMRLRDAITSKLNGVVFKDNDNDSLRTVIQKINRRSNPNDFTISIHFNAFDGTATGTEVFVYHGTSKEMKTTAEDLGRKVANVLDIPFRRLNMENGGQHSRLGILNDTVTKSMLIEICFVDNKKDVESYQKNFAQLVDVMADHINKMML